MLFVTETAVLSVAANPDMVGHTGDLMATRVACEIVDVCVGELLEVGACVDRLC